MSKYEISNVGCDDTTTGVFELTETQFAFLVRVFDELNENSYYGCMPKIYIKKVKHEE